MYPLIEIRSVPIEIQIKTTDASLEYTNASAEMEITRSDNGVDIKSRPIKFNLDTFESRAQKQQQPQPPKSAQRSVTPQPQPPKSTQRSVTELSAAKGQSQLSSSYEATAMVDHQGKLMLNAHLSKEAAARLALPQSNSAPAQEKGKSQPSEKQGDDKEQRDAQVQIRYMMDKSIFDWQQQDRELKFTPADIEVSIAQRNSITIKYLGGPIYVPPSADPNYVDEDA